MKKVIIILISTCLIISLFAACKTKNLTVISTTHTKSITQELAVNTLETSTTAHSAPIATTQPFVTTVATVTASPVNEIIHENVLGKPFYTATSVFKEVFKGATFDDHFATIFPDVNEYIKFSEGVMMMNVDDDKVNGWSCFSIKKPYVVGGDIKQNEFSVDFRTSNIASAASPWNALFVGCKVTNGEIAVAGTGFWVAFTDQKTALVYPGLRSAWYTGEGTVALPVSLKDEHTVTVVDNGNDFYYYIKDDSGSQWLILSAKINGANITVTDHDGKEVYKGATEIEPQTNTNGEFKIFNNIAQSYITKIEVKQV